MSAFLISGLLLVAGGVWGLRQGPVGFPDWVVARLVDRVDTAIAPLGLTAEIGAARISLREGLVPAVVLDDVRLREISGGEVLRLDTVDTVYSGRDLLGGRIAVQALRLDGVLLSLRRDAEGRFMIRLGDGTATAAVTGLGDLIARLRAVFDHRQLREIREIGVSDLSLRLSDVRSGRRVSTSRGTLRLSRAAGKLSLSVHLGNIAGLSSETALGRVSVDLVSEAPGGAGRATLALRGLVPMSIAGLAGPSPLSDLLSRLDAPVTLTLRADIGQDGLLREIAGQGSVGDGTILLPGLETRQPITSATGRVSMSRTRDRVGLQDLMIRTPRLAASGDVTLISGPGQPPDRPIMVQLALHDLSYSDPARFDETVSFDGLWGDAEYDRDSGAVRIASVVAGQGEDRIELRGAITPPRGDAALAISGEISAETLSTARLLSLWPRGLKPRTRDWLSRNIRAGSLRNLSAGLRKIGAAAPRLGLTFAFENGVATAIRGAAPLSDARGVGVISDDRLTIQVRSAKLQPPTGREIAVTNGLIEIADMTERSEKLRVRFDAAGDSSGALSLLDLPFFRGGRPKDPDATPVITAKNANGDVELFVDLSIPRGGKPKIGDIAFDLTGNVTGFSSDRILKNHMLRTERLAIDVSSAGARLTGPARLDAEPIDLSFFRPLGQGDPASVVTEVEVAGPLTESLATTLGVPVPPGALSGAGRFKAKIGLQRGRPPRLDATGSLNGLGVSLDALGWRKARGAAGTLVLGGRLGPGGGLDTISLDAAGLSLDASARFAPGGGIDALEFRRLRVGRWLDAAGRLIPGQGGRGGEVRMSGGTIDLRVRPKGGGGRGGKGGMPLNIALDRAILTDKIALHGVTGTLDRSGSGTLAARVNGGAPVSITVDGRSGAPALRVRADNAGAVLASAGLFANATGGALDLRLVPQGPPGQYRGALRIRNTAIRNAPVVAEILSAISVVGALEQLSGAGIGFSDTRADFVLNRSQIRLISASAVGPSIGLSLDGLVDLGRRRLDLQGVVSPFYFLNQAGSFMTRRGEGLVGITYTVKGPTAKPRVAVNPLSVLTPGFLREIFRRPTPGDPAPAGN